jgi:hypothetical protein
MIIEDLLMTNCFVRCCKAEEVDDSGKKRKLSFSPKAGEYFLLFKIDSENGFKFLENIGMQNPHNERKNDYIGLYLQVDTLKKVLLLIELKGKKINHARSQVKNVLRLLKRKYKEFLKIFELKVIIVHTHPSNFEKELEIEGVKCRLYRYCARPSEVGDFLRG